jgi:hypothetical protein
MRRGREPDTSAAFGGFGYWRQSRRGKGRVSGLVTDQQDSAGGAVDDIRNRLLDVSAAGLLRYFLCTPLPSASVLISPAG